MADPTPKTMHAIDTQALGLAVSSQDKDAPPAPPAVDLFGWDTAFAVRFGTVNQDIARMGDYPKAFQLDLPKYQASIHGKFGAWELVPGGDPEQVVFRIPMSEIAMKRASNIDVTGLSGTVNVLVRLRFIPDQQRSALKVRTTKKDDTDPFTINSLNVDDHPGNDNRIVLTLKAFLGQWFKENLDAFSHIFAMVDLNRTADKQQFQWMQPTAQAYAHADTVKNNGTLGVICMTSGRDPANMAAQLSSYLIPDGANAALGISKERMLQNMFLPMLPIAFKGATTGQFVVDQTTQSIGLKAGEMPKFEIDQLLWNKTANDAALAALWLFFKLAYDGEVPGQGQVSMSAIKRFYSKLKLRHHFQLRKLRIEVKGPHIIFDATCRAENPDHLPGVAAFCSVKRTLKAKISHGTDGPGISFVDAVKPEIKHWSNVSSLFQDVAVALSMVIMILGVAAAFLLDGAFIVPVLAFSVSLSLAVGVTSGEAVKLLTKDNAPALKLAASDASAPIRWAADKVFHLTGVSINEGLVLSGDFKGQAS